MDEQHIPNESGEEHGDDISRDSDVELMDNNYTDETNTDDNMDKASEEELMDNDSTEGTNTADESIRRHSRALITYSDAVRTPERPRKGKVTTYEYGGRSDSGMGTRKKSNITKRNSDPQHQTHLLALDNSGDDSDESDNGIEQTRITNTNIPAKGLRGDGET